MPYAPISDTRDAAARAARGGKAEAYESITAFLTPRPNGATAHQIADGLKRLRTYIQPRLTEMLQAGKLIDTGTRALNEGSKRTAALLALPQFASRHH
jgi:hypothetical protein